MELMNIREYFTNMKEIKGILAIWKYFNSQDMHFHLKSQKGYPTYLNVQMKKI